MLGKRDVHGSRPVCTHGRPQPLRRGLPALLQGGPIVRALGDGGPQPSRDPVRDHRMAGGGARRTSPSDGHWSLTCPLGLSYVSRASWTPPGSLSHGILPLTVGLSKWDVLELRTDSRVGCGYSQTGRPVACWFFSPLHGARDDQAVTAPVPAEPKCSLRVFLNTALPRANPSPRHELSRENDGPLPRPCTQTVQSERHERLPTAASIRGKTRCRFCYIKRNLRCMSTRSVGVHCA